MRCWAFSSLREELGGLGGLEVEQVGKGQDARVGFLVIVFVVVGAACLVHEHGDRELQLTSSALLLSIAEE